LNKGQKIAEVHYIELLKAGSYDPAFFHLEINKVKSFSAGLGSEEDWQKLFRIL
jgi:hypothetical protein